ncbi:MAG: hypothetical protein OXM61_07590 [Candidatus Poribacteria bacterium]|nr:hypothetical protein [Candidatus Poribacteria bacterium]
MNPSSENSVRNTENSDKAYSNPNPLNWIGIIDTTFSLYRKHFRLFIGIALLYLIHHSVYFFQERLYPIPRENLIYELVEDIINALFAELVSGVLIVAATQIYLNRHITIAASFRQFKNIVPRYFPHVFIYLIPVLLPAFIADILDAGVPRLSIVILITGFALFYLGCYYFEITWCLYVPIICVEHNSKPKPLSRSHKLIQKAWWRVFGTIFTLRILLRTIRIIFVVSFIILFGAFGLLGDSSVAEIVEFQLRSEIGLYSGKPLPYEVNSTPFNIIVWLRIVIGTLIRPLYPIAVTLIYFNQRSKQETRHTQK